MRIALTGVTKIFARNVVALDNVTLEAHAGEFLVLLGPSGSGKTTTLRLIAGLECPSSGTVSLDGAKVSTNPLPDEVAMVFQTLGLYPHLTARENIVLSLKVRKLPKSEVQTRLAQASELLGLAPFLDRKPHHLSGGERQRVALARAIVKRPRVLLLDEPFSNLDSHLRAELREELKRLHATFQMTVVCVTHDLIDAVALGQRIGVLKAGALQQIDTPERLIREPANEFVQRFVALPPIPEGVRALFFDGAPASSVNLEN